MGMAEGGIEGAVKAPIGWAKARPFVFVIFLFIVVLLVLRFRHAIARAISKIPKLGPWLVGGADTVVPAASTTPTPSDGSS